MTAHLRTPAYFYSVNTVRHRIYQGLKVKRLLQKCFSRREALRPVKFPEHGFSEEAAASR
jgi:hypothetical protein